MSTTTFQQQVGYHPLDIDYMYIQQDNTQEQEKKDKLIQAATQRLRQKLLEHKYEQLMSDIVEMQSKLDILKLEASISIQSMDTQHLDHFEKRLENHKLQLQSIHMSSSNPKRETIVKSNSSSLSSFSSTISSVFSFNKAREEEKEVEEAEDYFAILGHGRQKRRKRQKFSSSNSNTTTSTSTDSLESSSLYNNTIPDTGRKGLLVLHSIHQQPETNERNAFDDTLSFLNDLASDSDDGGFRQDIIELLDTIHYNNHHNSDSLSFKSIPVNKNGIFKSILYTSWKWTRFFLIMILAILINLKRGPSLF